MGVGNKGVRINRNYLVQASGSFVASLYSYILNSIPREWKTLGGRYYFTKATNSVTRKTSLVIGSTCGAPGEGKGMFSLLLSIFIYIFN